MYAYSHSIFALPFWYCVIALRRYPVQHSFPFCDSFNGISYLLHPLFIFSWAPSCGSRWRVELEVFHSHLPSFISVGFPFPLFLWEAFLLARLVSFTPTHLPLFSPSLVSHIFSAILPGMRPPLTKSLKDRFPLHSPI